jgi:parallel beta-helix repeat protein
MATLSPTVTGEVRLAMTRDLVDGTTVPVTGGAWISPDLKPGTRYKAANITTIVADRVRVVFTDGLLRDDEPGSTSYPRVLATNAPGISITGLQYRIEFDLEDVDEQPADIYFTVPAGSYTDLAQIADSNPQPGLSYVYINSAELQVLHDQTIAAAAAAAQSATNAAASSAAATAIAPSNGLRAVGIDTLAWNATDHGVVPGLAAASQGGAIQAAMTALSAAGGGVLLLPPGTWKVNGGITGADNVTLQGMPGTKVVKTSTSQLLMDIIGRKNFAIKGIDGWENSIRITDCEDFEISGNIFRRGAFTLSIRNTAAGTNGMQGCSRFKIRDNNFVGDHRDVCIDMVEPVSGGDPVRNAEISGNSFDNIIISFRAGGKWTAVFCNGGVNVKVNNNHVFGSEDTGIMLNNCVTYQAIGNYLRTTQLGIYAGASKYGTITGNDISSARDIGISLHARDEVGEPYQAFSKIAFNSIRGCGLNGIAIEGTTNVEVSSNTLEANNAVLSTTVTFGTTPSSVTWRPAGFADAVFTNTGSTTIYVGTTPDVTVATGTPYAPGATYTYPAGTFAYGVVASGTGAFTKNQDDNYKSAIGAWAIGSHHPTGISIFANTISKGGGSGLYGISVTGNVSDILVDNNNILTGFSTRLRYGTLSGRYKVQTSNGVATMSALLTVPNWETMISQLPTTSNVLAVHATHGLMISSGGVWKKVVDGTTVTP